MRSTDSPVVGRTEWQPITAAMQNCIRTVTHRWRDGLQRSKADRCDVLELVWVRELIDDDVPAGRSHRYAEVIKYSAPADDGLTP